MKRLLILVLAAAGLMHAQKLAATKPVPIVSDASVHYGFPRLIRAANGHLLMFYRVGQTHASDHSYVALKRSANGGKSWQPEQVLYKDPDINRSAHNPVAVVAKDGRIVLWISTFRYKPSPAKREHGSWTWSDDHGKTWADFRVFDRDSSRSSYYMTDAIVTSDGILGSNATFPPSGVGNCYALMWHSADDGRTWQVRSQLTTPQENRGDEVALLEQAPGQILCLLRTRRQPGATSYPEGLYKFVSGDGGKTWAEHENLHAQLGLTLQRPFLTRIDSRRVLLTGRDIERKEIVGFLSTDNGQTFGGKIVVDSYDRDGAYTACVKTSKNEVLMVYYADSKGTLPDLKSVRLKIK
jgi:hypothetical protein